MRLALFVILGFCLSSALAIPAAVSVWSGEGNGVDSISGHNGSLAGNTSFTEGVFGQAFEFDGSGDFVNVPHTSALDPFSGSFSADAWIKTNRTSGSQTIFHKNECGQTCISFVSTSSYGIFMSGGVISTVIRDTDATVNGQQLFGPFIADNEFHHVAMVRDQVLGEFRLYVDGQLEVNESLNLGADSSLQDNDGDPDPFVIGASVLGGSFSKHNFFQGTIDEVRFFNVALSDNDILQTFQAGTIPEASSFLLLALGAFFLFAKNKS